MITYIELWSDVRSGGGGGGGKRDSHFSAIVSNRYNISERLGKVYTLYAFLIISIYRLAAL